MDTLLGIRVFAKVAESGTFLAAAKQLKMSSAMVTKHVQALERRIGSRLIARTTRQFKLTEAGSLYYEHCRRLLSELDEVESAVASFSSRPLGHLRITAPFEYSIADMWPIIDGFMHRYPEISIDLLTGDGMTNLIEQEIDLAIRAMKSPRDSGLTSRKLATSNFILCASPEYLERAGTPAIPDDLAHHRCLLYGEAIKHNGWRFAKGNESTIIHPIKCMQANTLNVLREAALAGAGIVKQPSFNVWQQVNSGQLRPILSDWNAGELGFYAIFPSRKLLPAKTRLFLDHLSAWFNLGPDHDIWSERMRLDRPAVRQRMAPSAASPRSKTVRAIGV